MSRERIWIIGDDSNHYGEALGSAMMLGKSVEAVVPVSGKLVPVPQSRVSTVAKWYRYHSHRYRYTIAKSHKKKSGTSTALMGTCTDV